YQTRHSTNGKIEVRYLDVYQSRREAEALRIDQPNVIVLESDGHRRVMLLSEFYRVNMKEKRKESFLGEVALTAALLDVSSPNKKRIYFLAGHGEMRPDEVDGAHGLSQLRDELRQRNYDLAGLDLNLTHKIPDDAALIIIAGQQGRVQPFEVELLRNFLQTRAGRLILMLDPTRAHGLEDLLFDWGVIAYDNVIHDTSSSYLSDTGELMLRHFNKDHYITKNLVSSDLPVLVGPARVVTEDKGRSADDGLNVKILIATSETAWGETSYRLRIPAAYTPGQDLSGQLGVMVVSERLKPANNLPLSVRGGRLAVIGTADLVTNNRISYGGNLNLFLATVSWTIDRDTQLNIPPRPIPRFQLALSQDELVRLRLGLYFLVPGIVALLGTIVYWSRRN
ncbi:MAG: Gldg family protein, partial [Opitutae bacterium]